MLRLFSVFIFVLFGANAFAAGMTEKEKIDALLNAFNTPDITFVRNGEEHDGAWAKKHFEEKLKETKPEVKTANDFITKIASKSSHTDQPYMIKMKDGKTMESAQWLKAKLADMHMPSAGEKAAVKEEKK